MTNPNSESPIQQNRCVSDSPFAEVIFDDMEGDTTVRPIPPEFLQQAIAERDLIYRCLALRKEQEEEAKKAKPANPEAES